MVTKATKKGSKRRPRPDGSPITIGGGGGIGHGRGPRRSGLNVHCDFDEDPSAGFPEPLGGPGQKRFVHPGWHMGLLMITVNGRTIDLSPFLPDDGDCEVKVACSGSNDDVTIVGADPFGLLMNTRTYSAHAGKRHENPNGSSFITGIEVNVPSASPAWSFTRDFDEGDMVTVTANYARLRRVKR